MLLVSYGAQGVQARGPAGRQKLAAARTVSDSIETRVQTPVDDEPSPRKPAASAGVAAARERYADCDSDAGKDQPAALRTSIAQMNPVPCSK
jgi:hypothetical protein